MAEEDFRRLQATLERAAHPPSENADELDRGRQFTADLEVTLVGRTFKLRPDGGLIALLTYCARGLGREDDERSDHARQQAAMAAMFDLLAESVVEEQWTAFERHALTGKASIEDVEICIRQVIEAYTARPYWPGLRLLAGASADLAELDGVVLQGTGRSVATFTAREVCNLQLARVLAGLDQDNREVVLEDLYLDYSPEAIAMAQVQQMMADRKRREEEAARERDSAEGDGDSQVEPAAG